MGNGTSGEFLNSSNVSLSNNASLVFNHADALTYSGFVSGTGNLTQMGSGTLTLLGNNTYTGSTTISAGTLQVGNGLLAGSISGSGNVLDNGSLLADSPNNWGPNGPISGSGSLTQAGAGILTLAGSNTYTGATTISAGVLQVGNGGSGASIGGTSGVLDNGSLVFNHGDGVTFSRIISGSGSLTQTGTGLLTLLGSNTYTGGTTISGGTLQVGNGTSGEFLNSSNVSLSNNASLVFNHADALAYSGYVSGAGNLTQMGTGLLTLLGNNTYTGSTAISAGTLQVGNGLLAGSIPGSGNVLDNGSLLADSPSNWGLSGQISGSGSLTQAGTGILTLAGSNSYTGGTTINAGVLQVGNASALGPPTAALSINGGTLDLHGYNVSLGSLAGAAGSSGPGTIDNLSGSGSYTLGVGYDNSSSTFSGTLRNTFGQVNLTKAGTGALTLTGNVGLGGSCTVSGAINQPAGTTTFANSLYLGYNLGSAGAFNLSGTATLWAANEYAGYFGSGGFVQSGGTNTSIGMNLGCNPGSSGSYTLSGLGLLSSYGETVGGLGSGTLTQSGGTNNVSGYSGLYVGFGAGSSGVYNLSGSGLLWAASEYVGYSGTGTFNQSGGTNTVTGVFSLGGAGAPGTAGSGTYNLTAGALIVPGIQGAGGVFNLGGGTLVASAGFSTSQAMTLTGSGGKGNINTGGYAVTLSGVLSGSGGLNVLGQGNLTLAGGNTYSGGTTILAGTLSLNNAGALQNSTVTVSASNTLLFNSNSGAIATFNVGGLTGSGSIGLADGNYPVTLGVGGNGAGTTYSGVLAGPGSLVKIGAGSLTLSGSNGYTGGTTIAAGALQVGSGGSGASIGGTSGVLDNGSLIFNHADGVTFPQIISGSGSLTQTGAGILTLLGSNTYSGGTTISAGTLQVGNGGSGASIGGTGNVLNNGSLIFNHGDAVVFPQVISGSGGLTQAGAGLLTLLGSNTYSGGTTIAAGTLKLDFSQAGAPTANIINNLANSSSLALGGGTLAIQGKLGTTNSQQFNGLTVNPGSSAIVLTASTSNPLLLSLGGISRNAGGTVDFTLPSGTQSASNGITTSTPNTAAGILGGYATVSGTSWATNSGGNIIAYSATSSNYASGNLGAMTSNSALNVSPSARRPPSVPRTRSTR